MSKKIVVVLFVFIGLLQSCDTTEPTLPPPPPEEPKVIFLKLVTVSCTEAFITITANDTLLPVNINLNKDDVVLFNFTLTVTDTTIIDTTLQPNKTYTYQATAEINGVTKKSDTLQVKTLNTTSHSFTWQTFTFGNPEAGSSVLNDVAIIDENNIWAVGEIYMNDSLGNPDPNAYNAVHWDGTNWELKRIYYYGACSAVMYPPLKAVWAFDENNIVITNGGSIGWFDGTTVELDCGVNPLLTGAINKIWGMSNNDLYVVGNGGSIAHYQNGSWSKIESGTTTNLNDVWGYYDSEAGKSKILTVASNLFDIGEYRLLVISGNQAKDTLGFPYSKRLKNVWFKNNYSPIYVSGSDIMKYKRGKWEVFNLSDWVMRAMCGNDVNDVAAVDALGVFFHYNGIEWSKDESLIGQYGFESMEIKNNTLVIVGSVVNGNITAEAAIVVGKRMN